VLPNLSVSHQVLTDRDRITVTSGYKVSVRAFVHPEVTDLPRILEMIKEYNYRILALHALGTYSVLDDAQCRWLQALVEQTMDDPLGDPHWKTEVLSALHELENALHYVRSQGGHKPVAEGIE